MIGYYVHHVGRGHLHRAEAIARHLDGPVTVLSSMPRPASWTQGWVTLPRDDDGAPVDATPGGRLHWAPLRHAGLRGRMAAIAAWVAANDPAAVVADLSVEVTALVRLLGVPVVTTVNPGHRDDPAHQLGFDLATAIVAPWPDLDAGAGVPLCAGLARHAAKTVHVGGISRFDGRPRTGAPAGGTSLRLLGLRGAGDHVGHRNRRPAGLPAEWTWLERGPGNWTPDPWPDLCSADVVVTHCGLGALADVAAAGRPAVLVPHDRPHGEQRRTARALRAAGIGAVLHAEPADEDGWRRAVAEARSPDRTPWTAWSSGAGAQRAAEAITRAAAR